MMKYAYLAGTLGFTVLGQLAIKADANKNRKATNGNFLHLYQMLTNLGFFPASQLRGRRNFAG